MSITENSNEFDFSHKLNWITVIDNNVPLIPMNLYIWMNLFWFLFGIISIIDIMCPMPVINIVQNSCGLAIEFIFIILFMQIYNVNVCQCTLHVYLQFSVCARKTESGKQNALSLFHIYILYFNEPNIITEILYDFVWIDCNSIGCSCAKWPNRFEAKNGI